MTTIKQSIYSKKHSHKESLIYQFMQTAKWVALLGRDLRELKTLCRSFIVKSS